MKSVFFGPPPLRAQRTSRIVAAMTSFGLAITTSPNVIPTTTVISDTWTRTMG